MSFGISLFIVILSTLCDIPVSQSDYNHYFGFELDNSNFSKSTFAANFGDFADGVQGAFSFFNLTVALPGEVCSFLRDPSNEDDFVSAIYFLAYSDDAGTIRDHLSLNTFPTLITYKITKNSPDSPIDESFHFSIKDAIDGVGSVETETDIKLTVKTAYCETPRPSTFPTIFPSNKPTGIPTPLPTVTPTPSPTVIPTPSPTSSPTDLPTVTEEQEQTVKVKREWTTDAIVVVIVAGVALLILLICLLYFCRLYHKEKDRHNMDNARNSETKNLKTGSLQDGAGNDGTRNDGGFEGHVHVNPLTLQKTGAARKAEQEREEDNNKEEEDSGYDLDSAFDSVHVEKTEPDDVRPRGSTAHTEFTDGKESEEPNDGRATAGRPRMDDIGNNDSDLNDDRQPNEIYRVEINPPLEAPGVVVSGDSDSQDDIHHQKHQEQQQQQQQYGAHRVDDDSDEDSNIFSQNQDDHDDDDSEHEEEVNEDNMHNEEDINNIQMHNEYNNNNNNRHMHIKQSATHGDSLTLSNNPPPPYMVENDEKDEKEGQKEDIGKRGLPPPVPDDAKREAKFDDNDGKKGQRTSAGHASQENDQFYNNDASDGDSEKMYEPAPSTNNSVATGESSPLK